MHGPGEKFRTACRILHELRYLGIMGFFLFALTDFSMLMPC